jgi:hypothetical protein
VEAGRAGFGSGRVRLQLASEMQRMAVNDPCTHAAISR